MGVYAGVTDNYLTQSDQTKVADSVKKYSLWAIGKEGNPGRRPGIDLNFAENKSLVDDVSGSNLVTFTRTSAATYVDSNGVIKTTPINLLPYSFDFSNWIEGNITLKSSNNLAPDGTLTASLIGDSTSAGTNTFLYYSLNVVDGNTYSYSFYAKSTTSNQSAFIDYYDAGTNRMRAYVSLDDGTVTYNQNTANGTVSSENAGNGWWRITHTSVPNGSSLFWWRIGNYATGDIYVWGAQLESGSSSSDYISTNSVASGAPRFDHDPVTGESLGLLIEESRTNSEQYSQGFTSGWSLSYAQTTTGQSDPMGGTDAILVKQTNGTSTRQFIASSTGLNFGSNAFTVSVFVKYVNYDYVIFTGRDQDGPDSRIGYLLPKLRFQFSTETIAFQESTWPGSTQTLDYGFEKYPNGWYRLWMTRNISVRTNRWGIAVQSDYSVGISDLNFVTGDNSSSVLAFGFQVEQGAFLTSYIPTSGSTVTRSVDSALLSTSNWWDYTKGTAYAEYRGGLESQQSGYGRVWSPSGAATFIAGQASHVYNNRHSLWFGGTSIQLVGQEHLSSFAKNAITYSNNGTNCDIVSASYPSSTTGTANSSVTSTSHGIGRNAYATTNMLNGHIKRMTYWEQVLDPSTLQSLTE